MHEQLTDDERRLLGFFRCLREADKDACLTEIGNKALARSCPNLSVWCLLPPEYAGVSLRFEGGIWDPQDEGTYFEQARDGLNAIGEPIEWLIGSSSWDEDYIIPAFMAGASANSHKNCYYEPFNREVTRAFLADLRRSIVRSCLKAHAMIAKTIAEAEAQDVPVPNDDSDWIEYALTLDGETICGELGWHAPGEFEVDLLWHTKEKIDDGRDIPDEFLAYEKRLSPVLSARLSLYCYLKYRENVDEMPPSDKQQADIRALLNWIRQQSC